MLKFAWNLRSIQLEQKAYDCIGKQLFYLNDIKTAQHFHLKAMRGDLEQPSSPNRNFTIPEVEKRIGYHLYLESFSGYR